MAEQKAYPRSAELMRSIKWWRTTHFLRVHCQLAWLPSTTHVLKFINRCHSQCHNYIGENNTVFEPHAYRPTVLKATFRYTRVSRAPGFLPPFLPKETFGGYWHSSYLQTKLTIPVAKLTVSEHWKHLWLSTYNYCYFLARLPESII